MDNNLKFFDESAVIKAWVSGELKKATETLRKEASEF